MPTKKPKTDEPTTKEIAARITKHLHRFETDPVINAKRAYNKDAKRWEHTTDGTGVGLYYRACAMHAHGQKVAITYVTYQGSQKLTREEALAYLAWLDAGNIGTHRMAQAEK